MSKTDLILLIVFFLGFVLFLYGAKFYDAIVGYAGIYLFIGAIGAYLLIYIYKELTKKTPDTQLKTIKCTVFLV